VVNREMVATMDQSVDDGRMDVSGNENNGGNVQLSVNDVQMGDERQGGSEPSTSGRSAASSRLNRELQNRLDVGRRAGYYYPSDWMESSHVSASTDNQPIVTNDVSFSDLDVD
jgi:hypothetical protein